MNKPAEEPRTLLRRLLKKADEVTTTPAQAAGTSSSVPLKRTSTEASPVRPNAPVSPEPPQPLTPNLRPTQEISIPKQLGNVEERLQAESALEKLRQKTSQVAAEFAQGKLNRAQFSAIYARYNELRQIIERMLENDPATQAWQRVAQPGHTSFLRQHFEARVVSYAIYDYNQPDVIAKQGSSMLPPDFAKQVITALRVVMKTKGNPGPIGKQVDYGRWVAIIPGKFTAALVLFSLEPSARQVTYVQDLHNDFERANRLTLERGIRTPEQLVFPHRALFKDPK